MTLRQAHRPTHADLVEVSSHWLRNSVGCGVVLTERQAGPEVPDAIGWYRRGVSIVVEVKVSRPDFFADQHKPHRADGLGMRRYYLAPAGLLLPEEVEVFAPGWGLLEWTGRTVRRRLESAARTPSPAAQAGEVALLVSELRRYQIHGITYPPLVVRGDRVPEAARDTTEGPQ